MKPNEFESETHDILFHLFILKFMNRDMPKDDIEYVMKCTMLYFNKIIDLFPLEIAPEEFDGYVYEQNWNRYDMVLIDKRKNDRSQVEQFKIKFRFEQ